MLAIRWGVVGTVEVWGQALYDSMQAPEIAEKFDGLPEQLLNP